MDGMVNVRPCILPGHGKSGVNDSSGLPWSREDLMLLRGLRMARKKEQSINRNLPGGRALEDAVVISTTHLMNGVLCGAPIILWAYRTEPGRERGLGDRNQKRIGIRPGGWGRNEKERLARPSCPWVGWGMGGLVGVTSSPGDGDR